MGGRFDCYAVDNWDGDGAKAVPEDVARSAERFLEMLPRFDTEVGNVNAMAGTDGSIGLYWSKNRIELYVDFRANGRIRYFFTDGKQDKEERMLPPGATEVDAVHAVSNAILWLTAIPI